MKMFIESCQQRMTGHALLNMHNLRPHHQAGTAAPRFDLSMAVVLRQVPPSGRDLCAEACLRTRRKTREWRTVRSVAFAVDRSPLAMVPRTEVPPRGRDLR